MKKNSVFILVFCFVAQSLTSMQQLTQWDVRARKGMTDESEVVIFPNFQELMQQQVPGIYKELGCAEFCQTHQTGSIATTCKRFAMAKIYRAELYKKILEERPEACLVGPETPCNLAEYCFITGEQLPGCTKMVPAALARKWQEKLQTLKDLMIFFSQRPLGIDEYHVRTPYNSRNMFTCENENINLPPD